MIDIERISDSCGYGVPLMEYRGERPQQRAWIEGKRRQGNDALMDYVAEMNAVSVDGLPSVEPTILPRHTAGG